MKLLHWLQGYLIQSLISSNFCKFKSSCLNEVGIQVLEGDPIIVLFSMLSKAANLAENNQPFNDVCPRDGTHQLSFDSSRYEV